MNETKKKKLVLSFKKGKKDKLGRWHKMIKGKTIYFGYGKNKSDMKSYRAALKKYKAHLNQIEDYRRWATDQMNNPTMAFKLKVMRRAGDDPQAILDVINGKSNKRREAASSINDSEFESSDDYSEFDAEALNRESARALEQLRYEAAENSVRHDLLKLIQPNQTAPTGKIIAELVKQYLKHVDQRRLRKEITLSAVKSQQRGLKTFVEFAKGKAFGNELEVSRLITEYRQKLDKKMYEGVYKPNTVNDKTKFLKQFIKWCHKNYHLDEIPRSLDDVGRNVPVKKSGQPITPDELRVLWHGADDEMRCFILLGVNCGFKNSDISSLRASDLVDGRLICYRGKTGVPMNYKLMPETLQLIKKNKAR